MLLSNPFEPDVRVYKEAMTLVNNGFSVTILCWDREKKYKRREIYQGIILERFQLRGAYGGGLNSILTFFCYYIFILTFLLNKKFDAIHCHDLDTLPIGFIIGKFRNCKIIYDAHELEYFIHFPKFLRKVAENLEKTISKKADGILIVNSIQFKKFSNFISDKEKIIEIRNCPPGSFFDEAVKYVNKEKVVMGYIGYIQEGVGIEQMLNIFNQAVQSFNNIELLLVGKVHPNYQLKFTSLFKNTKKNIKIIGQVKYTEIKKYYQKIDILFILYSQENQYKYNTPTKMYEAMAHKIPVFISNIGDVKNIIDKSQCGYIVNPDNIDDVIDKLSYLLKNPKVRHKMGISGYEYARLKFNWELMESRLISVYKRMI